MATSCYKVSEPCTKAFLALHGLDLEPVPTILTFLCADVLTVIFAAQIVGFAGYSSYLTALSYAVYLQLGGVPAGQPGYDAGALPALVLHRFHAFVTWFRL